jgi:hypothetical protein
VLGQETSIIEEESVLIVQKLSHDDGLEIGLAHGAARNDESLEEIRVVLLQFHSNLNVLELFFVELVDQAGVLQGLEGDD